MASYYDTDGSCSRCLRSSPMASLFGLILTLIGGGAVGGGVILARRYTIRDLAVPHIYPYVDYVMYGVIAAIAVFGILGYIMCAFSSGFNAKVYFEGSRKSCCGRFTTMMFVVLYIIAIFCWTLLACVLAYPIISMGFMIWRSNKVSDATFDLSYYGLYKEDGSPVVLSKMDFEQKYSESLIAYCVAFGGTIFLVLGYTQMAVCTAMNWVRLGDLRYYDIYNQGNGQDTAATY